MVNAALDGSLDNVDYIHDDIFNVEVPQFCPNVPNEIINPVESWKDKDAYTTYAKKLAKMFKDNFTKKYPNIGQHIANAGPRYDE